jgi:hypothetical protein
MCERARSWLSPSGTSLLRLLSRRRDSAASQEGTGLGAGLIGLPESRIWTCGRAAQIYFERSSEPDGGGR